MSPTTDWSFKASWLAFGKYGPWWVKLLRSLKIIRTYVGIDFDHMTRFAAVSIFWKWRGGRKLHLVVFVEVSQKEMWEYAANWM